jgi:uncharacterized protein (DUF2235 family)
VGKNVVVCLDGTNNKIRAAANTNVVRLFDVLDLRDPSVQVAYYDPGVGTFSSPAAWTPVARQVSRVAGLAFGAGLRQNLGEAYTYLMSAYEPGDRLFVFGFSRGAYTARALTGMLEVFGLFRRGSENLVPYAVSEYAKQEPRRRNGGAPDDDAEREREERKWKVLREYARIHARELDGRKDHAGVHFLGLWDTVKAAGHLWRQIRWPYTRQLPHVSVVRHAVSIDEWRRPYVEYPVRIPDPHHLIPPNQDFQEVWFAGVHSDVGGMFEHGSRLSDIPLKWMARKAVNEGLIVRPRGYAKIQKVGDDEATGSVHAMGRAWVLLGTHRRTVPAGGHVHASVQRRIAVDPRYASRVPTDAVFVDRDWEKPHKAPRRQTAGPGGGSTASAAEPAVGAATTEPTQ